MASIMKSHTVLGILVLATSIIFCLSDRSLAENHTMLFQETTADFLKALGTPPASSLAPQRRTKGLQTKGPAAVVPDEYNKLVENPTARSLILFDFDSDAVKQESYTILQSLAEAMRELDGSKIVVIGHTDSTGSDEYNQDLSRRRAEAVKTFLISVHTIDPERLELQWYGEVHPLLTNNTKDPQNRRVEFVRVE